MDELIQVVLTNGHVIDFVVTEDLDWRLRTGRRNLYQASTPAIKRMGFMFETKAEAYGKRLAVMRAIATMELTEQVVELRGPFAHKKEENGEKDIRLEFVCAQEKMDALESLVFDEFTPAVDVTKKVESIELHLARIKGMVLKERE